MQSMRQGTWIRLSYDGRPADDLVVMLSADWLGTICWSAHTGCVYRVAGGVWYVLQAKQSTE
jgi:hypothetical protein